MNNETIYHIFLDRFTGDPKREEKADFAGGTLQGVKERLSYIHDLGATAVWLSPFYQSVAYHGYHITDFYSVDPHFGTESDLQELITSAHEKGMKVYADFVPNHLSKHHPYFLDAQTNENSTYRDWFFFDQWPNKYKSFLHFDEIPKINLDNPDARKHIIGSALHWASLGIDGFRVDHAIGPSLSYTKDFFRTMKQAFPNIELFGEVWADGIAGSMFSTIDIPKKWWRRIFGIKQKNLQLDYCKYFDGILDFHTQNLIRQGITVQLMDKTWQKKVYTYLAKFPEGCKPVCFLDNHDMDRFMFQCGNDIEKLKEGIRFLSQLPCPISIYYGTETGMTTTETIKSGKPHADLQVRKLMPWNNLNQSLIQFTKQCLGTRNLQ